MTDHARVAAQPRPFGVSARVPRAYTTTFAYELGLV